MPSRRARSKGYLSALDKRAPALGARLFWPAHPARVKSGRQHHVRVLAAAADGEPAAAGKRIACDVELGEMRQRVRCATRDGKRPDVVHGSLPVDVRNRPSVRRPGVIGCRWPPPARSAPHPGPRGRGGIELVGQPGRSARSPRRFHTVCRCGGGSAPLPPAPRAVSPGPLGGC